MAEFYFHINDGEITNPRVFRRAINDLPNGSYRCRIEKGKKRSELQNKFYWGCVLPIVQEGLVQIGYREVKTNEDAHEILKTLFLKKKVTNETNGDVIIIPGSTQKLTTTEFMTYLEEITQWAAQYLSITIPAPNSQTAIWNG